MTERERDREREREREREGEAELIIFDLEDDTVMPCSMYIVRYLTTLQQTELKQRIYFQKLIKVCFEFLFITAQSRIFCYTFILTIIWMKLWQ